MNTLAGRSESGPSPDFLIGGGEMGEHMRNHDWSACSLGHPAGWPQALRTVVRLMLNTGHPMYIWWGEDLACLYNDAYSASIGPERHPGSLGQPARVVWDEIWDIIGPQIEQVKSGGGATWHEDHLVPITRHGQREEVYWTYSYSPIDDETAPGGIGGVLVVCTETTARVLAARNLVAERDRFVQLFAQSPTFMAILEGPEHRFVYANRPYMKVVGDRPILGRTVAEALPDAVEQGYLALLDRVFKTGEAYTAHSARYLVKAPPDAPAVERFVDFVYQPIKDVNHKVTDILVQGADVTDRTNAYEALRQLNADLERRVLQRSLVGGRFWQISQSLLGVLNDDGYFESTNPAWQSILGWSADEISSQPVFDLLHPDDRAPGEAAFAELKSGNPIRRIDNRYRRKDGEYRWISWSAAPLEHAYYWSGRDFTHEKNQGAELAARTAELDRIWQNSRDLLFVIGSDKIFRAVNPAWKTILGYDPAEVVGGSVDDFMWQDPCELDCGLLTSNLSNFENRFRHKDGTLRSISWHTSIEGDLIYAYGRDITAEKATRAELAVAQEALRQSQKMEAVGQLTGGIAHDFNNLLAGISGSLELLERRLTQTQLGGVERYIHAAQGAARRAAALTQRLLAFSRRQTLDPKPTDVNELIDGLEEMIRRTMGPSIEVGVRGDRDLWLTQIDPSQLENALLNLCINARDAMVPNGGRLTISTSNQSLDERAAREHQLLPGEYISLCVSDTGAGMEPDVVSRAFDPFFTTKPLGEGTGLGLSMVYGFVRQSGGQVHIASVVGEGTTLCLYLPRYIGNTEEASLSVTNEVAGPGAGEAILIIDDEPTLRMLIAEVLEDLGYTAIEAMDGPAGLKILQSGARVDLLITDVGLPGGLNGRQVADAARTTRPELKVLFVTGYAENAAVGNGRLEAGMEVLTKPFTIAVLGNKVRDMLRR